MTFGEIARRVRGQLGQEHRYRHVVRVARCADVLAQAHGIDSHQARLAGMLHDLARLYDAKRLLEESRKRAIPVDDYALRHPIVLHAAVGADIARDEFGINDEAVLSAIRKHTLADGTMSGLDCVLYLADGLEPGREFAERDELFALSMRDLSAGMRATLRSSVEYLRSRGLPLAPQTARAGATFGLSPDELEVCTA